MFRTNNKKNGKRDNATLPVKYKITIYRIPRNIDWISLSEKTAALGVVSTPVTASSAVIRPFAISRLTSPWRVMSPVEIAGASADAIAAGVSVSALV